MSVRVEIVAWRKELRPDAFFSDLPSSGADYFAFEAQSGATSSDLIVKAIDPQSPADLIIVFDPQLRAPWQRLRGLLPPFLYLMTAIPEHDSAIAISANCIKSQTDIIRRSGSICEVVVRMAEHGTVAYVENSQNRQTLAIPVPHLTTPDRGPQFPWLREIIQQIRIPGTKQSTIDLAALKAGIFLLNDFFDESHECSQSIEGLGAHHTGDYWHAILHRREPDYGNSKYWFRHVSRHPTFIEVAQVAKQHMEAATRSLSAKLDRWKGRLVADGKWDPFAFVDLCSTAEMDSELQEWCERVQHDEMLLLLESTYRDAIGS